MKSLFITIFLLFFLQISWAQYTEVINSNRPGFSNSPYSVGTKVYQVEGGLFYNNIGNFQFYDPISNETFAYSAKGIGTDISFRTGQFLEKLEFILDLAVQNESRDFSKPQVFSKSGFGLSKLTIGAKYLVYKPEYTDKSKEIRSWKARTSFDKKRLIPAVGVYAGFNTNLLQEMFKNPDGISPRFAIFTQNDLSNRLVVLTNLIMDKLFTNNAENSYIITVTYALAEKWSVFGENQGFFRKSVPNDFQFGAGGAYLINNNIQADFSVRMIFDERNDSSYLIGGGISWRLDKHKDKIIQTETKNNEPLLDEKKGFFKGLFSGGIFKKNKNNGTKMRSVKTSKVKTRSLEPPVNKKAQKAKKKQNKRLIKEQKAKDKSQKKYNKKAKDKN
jgi:outer membrane putative beta-barrel porin/alpha-amylase